MKTSSVVQINPAVMAWLLTLQLLLFVFVWQICGAHDSACPLSSFIFAGSDYLKGLSQAESRHLLHISEDRLGRTCLKRTLPQNAQSPLSQCQTSDCRRTPVFQIDGLCIG